MARIALYARIDEDLHRWVATTARRCNVSTAVLVEALIRAARDQGVSGVEMTLIRAAGARGTDP